MQFSAKISATLTFTREEVEYLAFCAEHHYDSTIQAMVPPGEGAIINAMRVRFLDPTALATSQDYTFREIARLHKAIEFQQDEIACRLQRRFRVACNKINAIGTAINNLLETVCDDIQ